MRATMLGLGLTLAVAACGTTDYFLLPPPQPAARASAAVGTVEVADINLPSYAEASEIASLEPDGSVTLSGRVGWADTPRRALTRHLVASLDERLTAWVGGEPWPGFDRPGLRVEVIVDRLIGSESTGVEFFGQYVIVAPESGRIFATERFAIRIPPQGDGYLGLAEGHALAVEALADRIAARISGRAAPAA